ncbi:competence type IV pilus minor pilin ComGD [Mesobacillus harenae]|uniref:competence type IV pilus minor pilin ComGD n=1 Tax=Mesobacillus harenae TaxID=2213203 RepID=UPI001580D725|nr:competence type IV pilus minor pilin ComGD [Mesobacillus harenae]
MRDRFNSCEKGFTLTETLVVLSVFLVISSITLLLVKPQSNIIDKQSFFTQFKADLFLAQQYAISHQQNVYVNISPITHSYYIRSQSGGPIIVDRKYSRAITIEPRSLPLYFQFTPSGNITKFGSLYIAIGGDSYLMTFQIGKGRFYIVKE